MQLRFVVWVECILYQSVLLLYVVFFSLMKWWCFMMIDWLLSRICCDSIHTWQYMIYSFVFSAYFSVHFYEILLDWWHRFFRTYITFLLLINDKIIWHWPLNFICKHINLINVEHCGNLVMSLLKTELPWILWVYVSIYLIVIPSKLNNFPINCD